MTPTCACGCSASLEPGTRYATGACRMRVQRGIDLRLGDCLEVLRSLPDSSHDAMITDPPFTAAGGSTNGRSGGAVADSQFFLHWLRQVFAEAERVLSPAGCGFIFCDWRTISVVQQAVEGSGLRMKSSGAWKVSQALVWDRDGMGLGSPFRNGFEMIAFVRGPEYRSGLPKNIRNVIPWRWPYGAHAHHGAEKPVGLVDQLITYAEVPLGGRILDPFAGSGTTLVAAAGRGVGATGIELDLPAYETACGRLEDVGVKVEAIPEVRTARLLRGLCPECGSDVEWSLRDSRPGASSAAVCIWSGAAFLGDKQAAIFDAGRRCSWRGRVRRVEGGASRLEEAP